MTVDTTQDLTEVFLAASWKQQRARDAFYERAVRSEWGQPNVDLVRTTIQVDDKIWFIDGAANSPDESVAASV